MNICCEKLRINGIVTHETGCAEAWKDYKRKCKWCHNEFYPENNHQTCCDHSCTVVYNNYNCDCSECLQTD